MKKIDSRSYGAKPTRTNWDVLREDKQRVANLFILLQNDCGHEGGDFYAMLPKVYRETIVAAYAANLVWLDAPVANDNDKEGIT
jgi:hypothetical protein